MKDEQFGELMGDTCVIVQVPTLPGARTCREDEPPRLGDEGKADIQGMDGGRKVMTLCRLFSEWQAPL